LCEKSSLALPGAASSIGSPGIGLHRVVLQRSPGASLRALIASMATWLDAGRAVRRFAHSVEPLSRGGAPPQRLNDGACPENPDHLRQHQFDQVGQRRPSAKHRLAAAAAHMWVMPNFTIWPQPSRHHEIENPAMYRHTAGNTKRLDQIRSELVIAHGFPPGRYK